MKAAVISLGSTSSKWIVGELGKFFDKVDAIDIRNLEINFSGHKAEILYKGKPFNKYDCVHTLGSFRYAALLNALRVIINDDAYMTTKASTYTVAHDKLLTQLAFQKNNIPMPRTYVAATPAAARSIFEQMNYPLIMKFPHGTQGKGVLVAESLPSASSIMDALSYLRQPFLIQEYIDTDGKDVRVFVIGDQVIAAYERTAKENEMRSNIHQGGTGAQVEIDETTRKIAIKAAKSVGCEICGVDILMSSHKGPLALEVNISPGLQGVTQYTGVNVAEKIAKFLFKKTKEKKTKGMDDGMKDIISSLDKSNGTTHLISPLIFRGGRVLLSEVMTKGADLKEDEDYEIKISKNELIIKKSIK